MGNKILTIAEIGQAHEGSLGIAHSYIDAFAKTGVDAIKFQTHIAEAESSELEPFRVKFSYEDDTRYDYWKRMQFTEEQWLGLKMHCEEVGVEFISSPFSNKAVDLLERLNVKRYKIGSGEVTNSLLLERVAQTGKPVIISSGMSSINELEDAVHFLQSRNILISVLQCTTAYPTTPEQWGLNVMDIISQRLNVPVGYSDHSGDIFACLAAAALGAEVLEFHIVFDKQMFGPDAKASLTVAQTKQLVQGVRQIETALNMPVIKDDNKQYEPLKIMFGKTLAVNKNLEAGHLITFEDLESKKPAGQGLSTNAFTFVIGKKLNRAKKANEFLTEEDVK